MAAWLGPAIIAALISGSISLMGLYLGGWIAIRHERRRRREKVRDFQIALRAEIRSELHNLASIDFDRHFEEIEQRYASKPGYSVFPSYPARHVVFEALKGRQLEMYKDYVGMQKYLTETARLSARALDRSLGEYSLFSSPASVPSGR